MSNPIDTSICPVCGGPNHCGEIDPQRNRDSRCWCARETFPPGIFKLVPDDKRGKSCICRQCLATFKSDPSTAPGEKT